LCRPGVDSGQGIVVSHRVASPLPLLMCLFLARALALAFFVSGRE
jgi:hypothetical protein